LLIKPFELKKSFTCSKSVFRLQQQKAVQLRHTKFLQNNKNLLDDKKFLQKNSCAAKD
jgi:hypothetical protein